MNENIKWVYDELKKIDKDYDLGDYEEFDSIMNADGESRKWVYEQLQNNGYDIGDTYEEFESYIVPKSLSSLWEGDAPGAINNNVANISPKALNKPSQPTATTQATQPAPQPQVVEQAKATNQAQASGQVTATPTAASAPKVDATAPTATTQVAPTTPVAEQPQVEPQEKSTATEQVEEETELSADEYWATHAKELGQLVPQAPQGYVVDNMPQFVTVGMLNNFYTNQYDAKVSGVIYNAIKRDMAKDGVEPTEEDIKAKIATMSEDAIANALNNEDKNAIYALKEEFKRADSNKSNASAMISKVIEATPEEDRKQEGVFLEIPDNMLDVALSNVVNGTDKDLEEYIASEDYNKVYRKAIADWANVKELFGEEAYNNTINGTGLDQYVRLGSMWRKMFGVADGANYPKQYEDLVTSKIRDVYSAEDKKGALDNLYNAIGTIDSYIDVKNKLSQEELDAVLARVNATIPWGSKLASWDDVFFYNHSKDAEVPYAMTAQARALMALNDYTDNVTMARANDGAIKTLEEQIQKRAEENRAKAQEQVNANPLKYSNEILLAPNSYASNFGMDTEYDYLNSALEIRKEAKEYRDNASADEGFVANLWRGLTDKALDLDTWDFGLGEFKEAGMLMAITNKSDRGEALTAGEEAFLDAIATRLATFATTKATKGYSTGASTAESLAFMLEFAITPIKGGGALANKFARMMIAKYGKGMARKQAIKYSIGKGLAYVGGDLVKAGGMTATTGLPSVVADAMMRKMGNVSYTQMDDGSIVALRNNDGSIKTTTTKKIDGVETTSEGGESWGTAIKNAFLSRTATNMSEAIGAYLPGKAFAKTVGNKLGLTKLVKAYDKMSATDWAKAADRFFKKTQWNGFGQEYVEELVDGTLQALITQDTSVSDVFEAENLIDTALAVGVMSVLMSGAKTMGYRTASHQLKQDIKNTTITGQDLFGKSEWSQIQSAIDGSTADNMSANVQSLINNNELSAPQKKTILRYAMQVAERDALLMNEDKQALAYEGETNIDNTARLQASAYQGYHTTDAKEQFITNQQYIEKGKAVANMLGGEDADQSLQQRYKADGSYELADKVSHDADLDVKQKQAILDYLGAKEKVASMGARAQNDINNATINVGREVERKSNIQTGDILTATHKYDGKQYYVIDGNVVTNQDGSINLDETTDDIIVEDAESGERMMMSPKMFAEAQLKPSGIKDAMREELNRRAEAYNNTIKYGHTLAVGSNITLRNAEGVDENKTIASVDNNAGVVTFADGTTTTLDAIAEDARLRYSNQYQPSVVKPVVATKEQAQAENVGEPVVAEVATTESVEEEPTAELEDVATPSLTQTPTEYNQEEQVVFIDDNGTRIEGEIVSEVDADGKVLIEGADGGIHQVATSQIVERIGPTPVAEAQGDNIVEPTTDATSEASSQEILDNSNEVGTATSTAETPTQSAPLTEIPTDEKGKKQYEQASVEDTINDIYNDPELDEEDADAYVQARIDGASKRIAQLEKKKPKMGEDIPGFKAERAKWREQLEAQQASLAYWQGVQAQRAQSKATPLSNSLRTNESTEAVPNEKVSSTPSPKMDTPKAEPAPTARTQSKGNTTGLVDTPTSRSLEVEERTMLNRLAKALGVEIEVVPTMAEANAKIVGNKITLALDAEQGAKKALGHELLHRIKALSPEAYEEFAQVIEAINPRAFEQAMIDVRLMYSRAGRTISRETLREEVVADMAGELMYNADLMERFVDALETKSLKEQILNVIKSVFDAIKGIFKGADARAIAKAERVLYNAMKRANMVVNQGNTTEADSANEKLSIIGERGASALDKAEEATHRMENLDMARKMERYGYPTKSIRMATGWERGADGKWRYEIEDIKLKKEWEPYLWGEGVKLSEIVVGGELFKAYPELKNLTIRYDVNTQSLAYLDWEEQLIGVNPYNLHDSYPSVVHEIQHAIQEIEGFAKGGNSTMLNDRLSAQLNSLTATINKLRAEGKNKEVDAIQKRYRGLAEAVINNSEDDYGNYRKLGGEVESRNAEHRIGMTPEQRRATLLAETEDVAREDQIFLMENSGVSAMARPFEYFTGTLVDLISIAKNAVKGLFKKIVTPVSSRLVGDLKELGIEISEEYKHVVDNYAIRHTFNNHGGKGEYLRGQIPINNSDFELIPDIVNNYDNITAIVTKKGLPGILYEKTFEDGTTVYVEEIHNKHKELALVSMRKIKRPTLLGANRTNEPTPIPSSGKSSADKGSDNIGDMQEDAKYSLRANSQEVDDIVAKAKADGTYMKAPNGEPTNLTEKQWANVRTKAFKDWFGDWENDPENASKIVDENGEPMVVYHGTESDFNVFDRTKGRASMDIQGMFFSPWELDAQGYGRNVRAFYLNIRKPSSGGRSYKALNRYQGQMYAGVKARDYLIDLGYDGVDNYGEEFIAFEPNQIKSATDNVGTYSSEDNDTRYSLRGNSPFYSNAEYAVENIKQEKATPEQWLAMIQKNGGLKAGEDKWLGLSDWLKASDAKTLTKEEVLEFIKANQIVVEDVRYDEGRDFALDAQAKKNLAEKWGKEFADRFARAFNVEYDEYDERAIATPVNAKEALALYNEAHRDDWELYEDGTIPYEVIDDVEDWALTIAEGAMGDMRVINRTRLNYTTEGLDNKREIALVVPTINPYNQSDEIHFGDAGGGRAVAWVRFGETTDAEGNRVLVIDEIQSKRHQDGREKGYRDEYVAQREARIAEIRGRVREIVARKREINAKIPTDIEDFIEIAKYRNALPEGDEYKRLRDEEIALRGELGEITLSMSGRNAVPDAPFEKNWHELAMKRMLRYAAENGYDKVAWTTGEQQVERYNLGNSISKISVSKSYDGANKVISFDYRNPEGYPDFYQSVVDANGKIIKGDFVGNMLSDVVGKELATKLMKTEEGSISGDNLRLGGEGMKGFYDKMLPSFMNKYGKKWGVKVGEVTMPELQEGYQTMHSIDVTDAMKESVMEGQPLFRDGSGALSDTDLSYANDPFAKALGKSQRSNAKQAKFAERERKAMRNRVAELVEKLGIGERVELIEGGEFDNERKARAKGWYDAKSGKIVINLANHTSVADIERTLLHEAVAHYGLRELFGEQFDTFLDNVYNFAEGDIKSQIDALANSKGLSTRVATEEYLAGLAEDTNFEYLENQTSFWRKLKRAFMDMLESIGWSYKGPELSDNELRYILWRSWENMVNPGRHRSILGMAEDVVKREKFGIGIHRASMSESQVAEAEEMYNDGVVPTLAEAITDYKNLFTGAKELNIISFDSEQDIIDFTFAENGTMKEAQYIIDRIKNANSVGEFYPGTNMICIFAINPVKGNPFASLFHEHVHYAIDQLGGERKMKALVGELREIDEELAERLDKDAIYAQDADNEMITYSLEAALMGNAIEELKEALSPNAKKELEQILNKVGYEKGRDYEQAISKHERSERSGSIKSRTKRKIAQRDQRRVGLGDGANGGEKGDQRVVAQTSRAKEKSVDSDDSNLYRDGDEVEVSKPDKVLARDAYERMVSSGRYQFVEAVQDSMMGLKLLYKSILGKGMRIEEVSDFENAYLAENAMSSRNAAEQYEYSVRYMKPLLKAVHALAGANAKRRQELTDYMLAKHGLERNRVMAEREAQKTTNEAVKTIEKLLKKEREKIEKSNELFKIQLQDFANNAHEGNLRIGEPSAILEACGLDVASVFIAPTTLNTLLSERGLSLEDIKELPNALGSPLMVYETKNDGPMVAIVMVPRGEQLLTLAVKLETKGKRAEVTDVESIGQDVSKYVSEMVKSRRGGLRSGLRYVFEGSAQGWAASYIETLPQEQKEEVVALIDGFENPTTSIQELQEALALEKAKYDGVAKNLPTEEAQKWYNARVKTLDSLFNNGNISSIEYSERLVKLNVMYNGGYVALNRERDYSGLTALTKTNKVAEAEAIATQMVNAYEATNNGNAIDELWKRINDATHASLEKTYKGGLLSKAQYEDILGMYEYYIPLRGWEETTSDEVYAYFTTRSGVSGSVIKKAEGRKSKADDPIAFIGMMADDAIRQSNRNSMKQKFLNFVMNHPSDLVSKQDLWLQYDEAQDEWVPVFAKLDAKDSSDEVAKKIDEFEAKMESLAEQQPDKYKRGADAVNIPYRVVPGNEREHQVIVKRGGRTYVLTINGNPRAAQALNGLTNPDVNTEGVIGNILSGAEWVNRQLSAFYTTRNPDFVVSNYFRDMIYSNSMTWVKESPAYAWRFNFNCGKFNPGTMRWLMGKWVNGTLNRNDKIENLFYEFMMNGGETGYTEVHNLEKHKKIVSDELKTQSNKVKAGWKMLGMQLDELNRSVENVARFSAFVTSREMGRSITRSIYDAKEVSVNFNKKGSGGKMVNAIGQTRLGKVGSYVSGVGRLGYVFWNAGVQGMTNYGRNLKRYPKKTLGSMAIIYLLGSLVPYLGDDDDDTYYDLAEYIRRSNICIKVGDQWLTIPLPIEFRAMYGLGELYTGVIRGKEKYTDEELAYQIASQVSQVLPLDMLEGGGGVNPFIPSLAKPIVEAELNRGWHGMPIYKEFMGDKEEFAPGWTRVYKNTSSFLVELSKLLNELSGGDNLTETKGSVDINPGKVEYILKGMFGGIYSTANRLVKMSETAFGDREFDWSNMIIANRLIKSGDERTEKRKLQKEYYDYLEQYKRYNYERRNAERKEEHGILGAAEKANELYNNPDTLTYFLIDGYKDAIDFYRKEAKELPNEDEKKAMEDTMYMYMKEVVNSIHAVENSKR